MEKICHRNKIASLSLHRDPERFRVNEIEPRAYFIPFEEEAKTKEERSHSSYFHMLNGTWKFWYCSSLYDMEDFYETDYDLSSFSEITVPENWQLHGEDYAQYQSSPYPFIFDPPNVPEKNPCAAYVKDFECNPENGKKYELHLEGNLCLKRYSVCLPGKIWGFRS